MVGDVLKSCVFITLLVVFTVLSDKVLMLLLLRCVLCLLLLLLLLLVLLFVFAGDLLLTRAIHCYCLLAVLFLFSGLLGLVFAILRLIVRSVTLLGPLACGQVVHLVHQIILLPLALLFPLPLLLQLLLLLLELFLLGHVQSAGIYPTLYCHHDLLL